MLPTLATAALLGVSATLAAPWSKSEGSMPMSRNSTPGSLPHGGYPSHGQVPFKFPLSNGFPNIKVPSAALTKIEQQAHGTLPNGPLSSSLKPGDETVFELIAFNELFEVAFFTSLINNITNNVPGFETDNYGIKNFVLEALTVVQGQEELHALGANGILAAAGQQTVQPCEYIFPSSDFQSAINFARTFTDVVLGTLQGALNALATNGDIEYVPLIGSVIGQEGEQNGYYRELLGLVPSELPFLTRSSAPFAFNALNQNVVVNGSCPNINIINLPTFGVLKVLTQDIKLKDQTLEFTISGDIDWHKLSVVYINQQNLPIVEKVQLVAKHGNEITIKAFFPAAKNLMNGLTIAAVTSDAGPFQNADDVAKVTLFGPGLIEIN